MLNNYFFLVLSFCLTLEVYCHAQAQHINTERPKIGVVLSGGGAKGLAHIGFLKVMEEAGIRPDFIGGTSMGSIVGGLYAIGYSADSLEKIAKHTDWSFLFNDEVSRRNITLEEKDDNDRFIISFPLKERKILIPSGIVNGQNIENTLNMYCAPVYGTRNFNEFSIPFTAIATDIETGDEVIFREGYLPEVMRASMAIPSVFQPVEINNKLLVDGGVVNNFPVKRVKEMGADIIIGVDVGFQYYQKDELNTLIKIIEQTVFFYGEELNRVNKSLADYLIIPELKEFNASSFNAVDTIIARGEQASMKILPQLVRLADSIKLFDTDFQVNQVIPHLDSLLIKEINITGLNQVSRKLVSGKLQINELEKYTAKDIKNAIDRTFSSLYFDKVTWELEKQENDEVKLNVNVQEAKGGLFRLGLHYDTNTKSAILLNTTFRNLIFDGSKLSGSVGLGENPYLNLMYFKNNGWKPGLGINVDFINLNVFEYNEEGKRISNLGYSEGSLQLYTQSIIRNSHAIGFGAEFEKVSLKPRMYPTIGLEPGSNNYLNYYGFLKMDTYDNAFFPEQGIKMYSEVKIVTQRDNDPVLFVNGRISKAAAITSKFTFITHAYGGFVDGDSIPYPYYFYAGGLNPLQRNGLIPFVGLNFLERADKNALILRADFQVEVFRNLYITCKLNAGNLTTHFNDLFTLNDLIGGAGITLSFDSWIGPIEYTLMRSLNKSGLLSFFNIGYWF
jgi:NTE family protein